MSPSRTLVPDGPDRWRIERTGAMRVPGVVYASQALLPSVAEEEALEQVANVATLPGIVSASYAMPDVHWGYGFPIGGVAATDVRRGGVVSPGGVGFDISCGVRLLLSPLDATELSPHIEAVMDELDARIPTGLGAGGVWPLAGEDELIAILGYGARQAVAAGFGTDADLARCDIGDVGVDPHPETVGDRARPRGRRQVGSLGSGNHFLEVQVVDVVLDEPAAAAFGLRRGQVCVMIHCGSRGLGHQICSDHVQTMRAAMHRFGIEVPDPQLACAPVDSAEGQAYLGAMAAAANYGRANRQALTAAARDAFTAAAPTGSLDLLYDVSHNLASLEWHQVGQELRLLCVHRKGATRALAPGHPELPEDLRGSGPTRTRARVDGYGLIRPGRCLARRGVLLCLPWCGPHAQPARRTAQDLGNRIAQGARAPRHSRARRVGARVGRGGAVRLQGRRRGGGHLRTSWARSARGAPSAAGSGEGVRGQATTSTSRRSKPRSTDRRPGG